MRNISDQVHQANIPDYYEGHDGSDPLGSDEVHCQTFVGRGVYWEEKFQSALKQCRLEKGNNETVEIRIEFEPDNPRFQKMHC